MQRADHHRRPRSVRIPAMLGLLAPTGSLVAQDHGAQDLAPPLEVQQARAGWVVLHAEQGSVIYAGLKRGFDRHALERELMRGTVELRLHRFEPQVGDCVFIPAGTVHALGAGLVIAEIQQAIVGYDCSDSLEVEGALRALRMTMGITGTPACMAR